MESLEINEFLTILDIDDFIRNYGLRSYNLCRLSNNTKSLGFTVPHTALISSSLSQELRSKINTPTFELNNVFNVPSDEIISAYYEKLFDYQKYLLEISNSVAHGNTPIIRGTSCGEGFNNLSFAGVCHSCVPKDCLDNKDKIIKGTAAVISSVYSPYAQYYFDIHNTPVQSLNVGLVLMELIPNPIFHVTAYVYSDEIRMRYIPTPKVGIVYSGGGELILNSENETNLLKKEFGSHFKIWQKTITILHDLPKIFDNKEAALDVELLIYEEFGKQKIGIVQVRPVSQPHFNNYFNHRNNNFSINILNSDILINESYLYHSFGKYKGEIIIIDSDYVFNADLDNKICLIEYNSGEGLFSFIKKLPHEIGSTGLIIMHPGNRPHDHFQYSIYEDARFSFVLHVDKSDVTNLKNGMMIEVASNAEIASIKIV